MAIRAHRYYPYPIELKKRVLILIEYGYYTRPNMLACNTDCKDSIKGHILP